MGRERAERVIPAGREPAIQCVLTRPIATRVHPASRAGAVRSATHVEAADPSYDVEPADADCDTPASGTDGAPSATSTIRTLIRYGPTIQGAHTSPGCARHAFEGQLDRIEDPDSHQGRHPGVGLQGGNACCCPRNTHMGFQGGNSCLGLEGELEGGYS